jgi:hypothetical protein
MEPSSGRWIEVDVDTLSDMLEEMRSRPARRVYYMGDETQTSPDLVPAFEDTASAPVRIRIREPEDYSFEDEPTHTYWALPALAALVGGFLLGRWWVRRKGDAVLAEHRPPGDTSSKLAGVDLDRFAEHAPSEMLMGDEEAPSGLAGYGL